MYCINLSTEVPIWIATSQYSSPNNPCNKQDLVKKANDISIKQLLAEINDKGCEINKQADLHWDQGNARSLHHLV
jgi:hypothetical protein